MAKKDTAQKDTDFNAHIQQFVQKYVAENEAGFNATRFKQALLEANIAAAGWPREFGGLGWSESQLGILYQACATLGVPSLFDVGVHLVAPLLMREYRRRATKSRTVNSTPVNTKTPASSSTAQSETELGIAADGQILTWLDEIKALGGQWCIGYLEPNFYGLVGLSDGSGSGPGGGEEEKEEAGGDVSATHEGSMQSHVIACRAHIVLGEGAGFERQGLHTGEKFLAALDEGYIQNFTLTGQKFIPLTADQNVSEKIRWICCLVALGGGFVDQFGALEGDPAGADFHQDMQQPSADLDTSPFKPQYAWFVVDLNESNTPDSLHTEMRTGTAGERLLALSMVNHVVPTGHFVGLVNDLEEVQELLCVPERVLLRTHAAAQQLLDVEQRIAAFDPEDVMHRQVDELKVSLAALAALEQRYIDAQISARVPPFPLELLNLKGHEIFTQLGALQVQSFGYYALPYLDEVLSHNEGGLGQAGGNNPDGAILRQALRNKAGVLDDELSLTPHILRDEIARQLALRSPRVQTD